MMDVLISAGRFVYRGVISINGYLPLNADGFGIRRVLVPVCSIVDQSRLSGLWSHPGSGDSASENHSTRVFIKTDIGVVGQANTF